MARSLRVGVVCLHISLLANCRSGCMPRLLCSLLAPVARNDVSAFANGPSLATPSALSLVLGVSGRAAPFKLHAAGSPRHESTSSVPSSRCTAHVDPPSRTSSSSSTRPFSVSASGSCMRSSYQSRSSFLHFCVEVVHVHRHMCLRRKGSHTPARSQMLTSNPLPPQRSLCGSFGGNCTNWGSSGATALKYARLSTTHGETSGHPCRSSLSGFFHDQKMHQPSKSGHHPKKIPGVRRTATHLVNNPLLLEPHVVSGWLCLTLYAETLHIREQTGPWCLFQLPKLSCDLPVGQRRHEQRGPHKCRTYAEATRACQEKHGRGEVGLWF